MKEWDTTVVYNFLLTSVTVFPENVICLGANDNDMSYLLLNYQRHSLAWLC